MKNFKKLFALILALALALSLAACGSNSSADNTNTDSDSDAAAASYKVAIVQQLDHASLDEIRLAIEAELDAQAAEKGIEITYAEFNGQNDPTVLAQIGSQVVDGAYDAVIPIATLAAQTMVTAVEDHPIPVIFAAITDPEAAGLTGIDYVTGTSDALNTAFIMDMMFAQNPDIQTVGLLYSNSEINSAAPIAEAKAYLEDKGIAYVEKTGNTTDEIQAAVSSLVGEADAIFTPTDNVVMAAELSIYETLATAGIPHYTGADSFALNGAFLGYGVDYANLGRETADMIAAILLDGADPASLPVKTFDNGTATVNTETCAAIGFDFETIRTAFAPFCTQVMEIQTAESFE